MLLHRYGCEVYGRRGPKGGALRALVDGTVHGDAISQERTTATYDVLLARIGGLNRGKHTVRIETDPSTAADVVTGVDYLRISCVRPRATLIGVGELRVDAPVVGSVQVDAVASTHPVGGVATAEFDPAQVDKDLEGVHVEGACLAAEVIAVVDVQAFDVRDGRSCRAGSGKCLLHELTAMFRHRAAPPSWACAARPRSGF
ncbi:hypothetical protein ABZY05_46680 [Streptomyces canus]|uniref:hypothetical protein n=1 Tax=Streptomyces canus TaxID=58343 RepID=UPI0033A4196E